MQAREGRTHAVACGSRTSSGGVGESRAAGAASSASTLTITLRRKGVDYLVHFDAADAHLILPHKWCISASPRSTTLYAIRSCNGPLMHRVILGLPKGDPRQGDHENNNGLDNRRSNLRVVTPVEQAWNKRVHRDTESGFKGVRQRSRRTWGARIVVRGTIHLLGSYPSAIEAAQAYNAAAVQYHGEFARLNEIPERVA